jgi:hypothetical protein
MLSNSSGNANTAVKASTAANAETVAHKGPRRTSAVAAVRKATGVALGGDSPLAETSGCVHDRVQITGRPRVEET